MFYARNTRERELLAEARVSVIGCGSFGSALADMLVRAGLGRLTLIDPEDFAIENVGRHVLTGTDVGRAKTEALADHLRRINPGLDVEARREKFHTAEGLLLCCADSRRCESMVNAVSIAHGLPAVFVGAYGAARAGEVQICIPGKTPCRECFAGFRDDAEPEANGPERYTDPDFDETRTPARAGLWGSILAIAGVAFHAVLGVLGVRETIDTGRPLWIINLDYEGFRPYAVTYARVKKGCPVCDESTIAELTLEW